MTIVQWQLLPVFLHVALVGYLGIRLGRGRVASARSGKVRLAEVALDTSRWPARLRQIGNNFDNQFQVPVLWYAGVALLLATRLADAATVVLSFMFVATRLVHTLIHTGSNNLARRFYAFAAGFGCVLAMWIWFGLRLYVTG
jgi:hypothetical protein